MARTLMCSSYTISGAFPGEPRAARHSLENRLGACAAAGYSGYWMHFRDYLEQKAAGRDGGWLRDAFDRHGLPHRGIEFLTDWFLVGDDGARRAEDAAFTAAEAIGAQVVNAGADFLGRNFPRSTMIAAFSALCGRAADRGLSIALEFVPWSDVPDVVTALEFLEPPNAGIVVDCWHVFRGGVPLTDLSRIPPERVLCVQVNDGAREPSGPPAEDTRQRKLCGEGDFPLADFAAALDGIDVDLPYSVEIISPDLVAMTADEAARRSFASARATFP